MGGVNDIPWFDVQTGQPTTPPNEFINMFGTSGPQYLDERDRYLAFLEGREDQIDDITDPVADLEKQLGYNQGYYAPRTGEPIPAFRQLLADYERTGDIHRALDLHAADERNRRAEDDRSRAGILQLQLQQQAEREILRRAENEQSLRDARMVQYLNDQGVDISNLNDFGEATLAFAEARRPVPSEPPSIRLDLKGEIGALLDDHHRLVEEGKFTTIEEDGVPFLVADWDAFDLSDYSDFFYARVRGMTLVDEESLSGVEDLAHAADRWASGASDNSTGVERQVRDYVAEFLANNQDTRDLTADEIELVTRAVVGRLRKPFHLDGAEVEVQGLIGMIGETPISANRLREENRIYRGLEPDDRLASLKLHLGGEEDPERRRGIQRAMQAVYDDLIRFG